MKSNYWFNLEIVIIHLAFGTLCIVISIPKKGVYKNSESSSRRLREDEQVVQDLLNGISEFESFAFDPSASNLPTLQSAIPPLEKLIADEIWLSGWRSKTNDIF